MTRQLLAACLALTAFAATAVAQTPVKRGRNFFSKDQDIEIGRESAKEAEKEFPLLRDEVVQRYVAELGTRLALQAPGYKFPYSFKVVDIADINAFALPGGPIYINRGTIEQARSEGELAGVIAHEIAHVDLRHGTRQASKAVVGQFGLAVLGGVLGSGQTTQAVINQVGGFGLNTLFLKYSRTAESESDILGSQILARAGYAPKEMASFFEVLEQQSSRRTAEFFSSHPAPERRRERIEQEAALLGANPPQGSQDRFKDIQARLRSMPPAKTMEELAKAKKSGAGGTLPQQPTAVEPPSRSLAWYDSRSRLYRVAYPENWQVISEGDATVTLAAPGGAYRRGSSQGVEITHGALLGVHDVPGTSAAGTWRGEASRRLETSTDELIAALRQDGPYLQVVAGSRRRATVGGGDGLVTVLAGTPPGASRRERVSVVTTEISGGDLVYMLYVTPDDAPREYDDLLGAMIRNLKVAATR